MFRLIETETSRVLAGVNEIFNSPVRLDSAARELAARLRTELVRRFPLRGLVLVLQEQTVMLNIGEKHGVRPGMRFNVVDTDVIIEAVSVHPNGCSAIITQGQDPLVKHLRVEAII